MQELPRDPPVGPSPRLPDAAPVRDLSAWALRRAAEGLGATRAEAVTTRVYAAFAAAAEEQLALRTGTPLARPGSRAEEPMLTWRRLQRRPRPGVAEGPAARDAGRLKWLWMRLADLRAAPPPRPG